ncbi:Uncharacterized mitochondrial protein AtMg00310 [Linum grandiflorum]
MNSPYVLVTRIFKAKYFSKGDFLPAPVGGSPSLAWRSIWGTQDLLKRGYCWRIGDGKSIGVWTEPWLREEDRTRIITPVVTELENLTVNDLSNPEMRLWDEELLEELFVLADIEAIQNVAIGTGGGADQRIWNWSKRGEYTVKLAYKLYMAEMVQRTAMIRQGEWRKLWNLPLPPKVRHYTWRLTRRVLPLRHTLRL